MDVGAHLTQDPSAIKFALWDRDKTTSDENVCKFMYTNWVTLGVVWSNHKIANIQFHRVSKNGFLMHYIISRTVSLTRLTWILGCWLPKSKDHWKFGPKYYWWFFGRFGIDVSSAPARAVTFVFTCKIFTGSLAAIFFLFERLCIDIMYLLTIAFYI